MFAHAKNLALFGRSLLPGVALCAAIAGVATAIQWAEEIAFGAPWIEPLVIAILLGTLIRSTLPLPHSLDAGVKFSAKFLLEVAVVLLGASISGAMIVDAGPKLLGAIIGAVVLSLTCSYGLGRAFGLPRRMATLIACGNSICGNSAIAAVAPVIDADSDDVVSAIAFTAVLGVLVVLALPALDHAFHMSDRAFGVLAGLTVYAVPQVLAATAPVSILSGQIGTLVKLVRVLMLGPVVLTLSLFAGGGENENGERKRKLPPVHHMAPWFILGFLALIALRSLDLIPAAALAPASVASRVLTVISMAALGLGVDVAHVAAAGLRVIAVVTLSILMLAGGALLLIHVLALG